MTDWASEEAERLRRDLVESPANTAYFLDEVAKALRQARADAKLGLWQLEELEARINGHMDALRPLLQKWSDLTKTVEPKQETSLPDGYQKELKGSLSPEEFKRRQLGEFANQEGDAK